MFICTLAKLTDQYHNTSHEKNTIIIFPLLSISCFSQNKNKFSLYGKTKDIPDGTVLLLKNDLTEKFIDSVMVKNNTFLLQTNLPSSPLFAILFKDSSTAKRIWLENNPMTFQKLTQLFSTPTSNIAIEQGK